MIRIIVAEANAAMAANVGGPVQVTHKTFDVGIPELEAWLKEVPELNNSYLQRCFVGIELLEAHHA